MFWRRIFPAVAFGFLPALFSAATLTQPVFVENIQPSRKAVTPQEREEKKLFSPSKAHRAAELSGRFYVLCYHRFHDGKEKPQCGGFCLSTERFREQLQYLKEQGFQSLSLKDIEAFYNDGKELPEKAVLFSFDDGYREVYTLAFPIMEEFGFKGVLFLYPDFLKGKGANLRKNDIEELLKAGWEMGSHGKAHLNLEKIREVEGETVYHTFLKSEVEESRELLKAFGPAPKAYAYPFGVYSASLEEALKKNGYTLAFTIDRGPNDETVSPLRLRRYLLTAATRFEQFRTWFNEEVLHLEDIGPGPGEVLWNTTPLFSARVLDDVDPSRFQLFLGPREQQVEWHPQSRLIRTASRLSLRFGGHQITLSAKDHDGRPRVFSWYFRVQHRKEGKEK